MNEVGPPTIYDSSYLWRVMTILLSRLNWARKVTNFYYELVFACKISTWHLNWKFAVKIGISRHSLQSKIFSYTHFQNSKYRWDKRKIYSIALSQCRSVIDTLCSPIWFLNYILYLLLKGKRWSQLDFPPATPIAVATLIAIL